MNCISLNRRSQIINYLVGGNSIRSTERMTNTHRATPPQHPIRIKPHTPTTHRASFDTRAEGGSVQGRFGTIRYNSLILSVAANKSRGKNSK